jgi:hypothetical protein
MLKLTKMKRILLPLAAASTIGFSIYGVFNTVSALGDSAKSLPTDYPGINATETGNIKPDGTFCNPYGCAGCNGCVSLQYQQNVEGIPGSNTDLINED